MQKPTLFSLREELEREEKQLFCKGAALSKDHSRQDTDGDYRLGYKRDVDRILHSKGYTRYADKTQVIYLLHNDHITHRNLHVQLVSGYARGIGRALGLNTDLIEAIALGHDVGHPPFGHEGESYLSQLSVEHGNGPFAHPLQSCRLFRLIEPLNLGFAVYDGFLCHDGGLSLKELTPVFDKTEEQHQQEMGMKKKDPDANLTPATLEGCLVKICDTISYLCRDIEDAIRIGLFQRKEVAFPFGAEGQKGALHSFAKEIISASLHREKICLSESAFAALAALRAFNFAHIYFDPRIKKESERIKKSYRMLFTFLLEDFVSHGEKSHLFCSFLSNKSEEYVEETQLVQCVVDYMAGMTDGFFLRTLRENCKIFWESAKAPGFDL